MTYYFRPFSRVSCAFVDDMGVEEEVSGMEEEVCSLSGVGVVIVYWGGSGYEGGGWSIINDEIVSL